MLLFDEICHLAKAKDIQALTRKINEEKACVDVRKGIYSPVMLLAQQGEEEAVTLLISKFNASRKHAVRGYAHGGHTAQVNTLLDDGVDRDCAVAGYARGGHAVQVDVLLGRGASRDSAVRGYAQGGHTAQVDVLLGRGANRDWAVRGYAQGGHTAQVDALLSRGASRDYAVLGYAQGGHTAQVDALLDRGADRDYAVLGYAQGGHTAQVDALLDRGADQNDVVHGYALGGHIAQVNALLDRGADQNYAVRGYALGGHIAQVNALLDRGAYWYSAWLGYVRFGYAMNYEELLRVMTLTNHRSLRNTLAQIAPMSRAVLLKKSHGLMQLMKKNHLSYPWARVFTPALNFLFLQGHLLMKKGKFPVEILLKISSFISGFSTTDTYVFLSRHYVGFYASQRNQLKAGRDASFFRRQALLVGTIAASERNFLLVPAVELTFEDKALTLSKSELRTLLYEEYPKKRHTFWSHGACSKILNLDGSVTIKQLKELLKNTSGDSISLEAVRKAIHRTKIDFFNNDEKSGTDFVLTQIKEKFIEKKRGQMLN